MCQLTLFRAEVKGEANLRCNISFDDMCKDSLNLFLTFCVMVIPNEALQLCVRSLVTRHAVKTRAQCRL